MDAGRGLASILAVLLLTACAVPLVPVFGPLTITPAPIVVPLPDLSEPCEDADKDKDGKCEEKP